LKVYFDIALDLTDELDHSIDPFKTSPHYHSEYPIAPYIERLY
jgi:hypothetical protein